jgi:hypothetical protein
MVERFLDTLRYWIDELQQNVTAGRIVLAMCARKCDLSTHPDTSAAEQLAAETGAMPKAMKMSQSFLNKSQSEYYNFRNKIQGSIFQ